MEWQMTGPVRLLAAVQLEALARSFDHLLRPVTCYLVFFLAHLWLRPTDVGRRRCCNCWAIAALTAATTVDHDEHRSSQCRTWAHADRHVRPSQQQLSSCQLSLNRNRTTSAATCRVTRKNSCAGLQIHTFLRFQAGIRPFTFAFVRIKVNERTEFSCLVLVAVRFDSLAIFEDDLAKITNSHSHKRQPSIISLRYVILFNSPSESAIYSMCVINRRGEQDGV